MDLHLICRTLPGHAGESVLSRAHIGTRAVGCGRKAVTETLLNGRFGHGSVAAAACSLQAGG